MITHQDIEKFIAELEEESSDGCSVKEGERVCPRCEGFGDLEPDDEHEEYRTCDKCKGTGEFS